MPRLSATLWQPMDTAPKDGTRILITREGSDGEVAIDLASWDDERFTKRGKGFWKWESSSWMGVTFMKSHPPMRWMPLPEVSNDEAIERVRDALNAHAMKG